MKELCNFLNWYKNELKSHFIITDEVFENLRLKFENES